MQYHLELHELEHKQRVRDVEKARVANEVQAEQDRPNRVLLAAGDTLVKLGERLQQQARPAQPVPSPRRSRA